MKLYVVMRPVAPVATVVEVLLPHEVETYNFHGTGSHSLWVVDLDNNRLLPYALNIVGSQGGESVERGV